MKTKAVHTRTYEVRDFSSIIKPITCFFHRIQSSSPNVSPISQTYRKKNAMKPYLPLALLLIIIGGIIVMAGRIVIASSKPTAKDSRAVIKGPKATAVINKEFSFPLADSKGKELTRLKYIIESAEIRDEIIVKGTRATSVAGRTFLILNIKLINDYDKAIDVKARDYLRVTLNGNESELLAADIHNDPVNLQAISTKITRLGFPINDSDTNIVLKVGEITGEKESIPLTF
jgi:hypothetical protein